MQNYIVLPVTILDDAPAPQTVVGTRETWSGYSPVPVRTPNRQPVLEPDMVPNPTPNLIPQLVPDLYAIPTLVPDRVPSVTQREPMLIPDADEQKTPMLVPHYDPWSGVNTPSYLNAQHVENFDDIRAMVELEATHNALPKFKEKLNTELQKVENEPDSAKKAKGRADAYGEAMAAFLKAKHDAYTTLMQQKIAEYLSEQKTVMAERKQRKQELYAKKHEYAIQQIATQTAKKAKEQREND